MNEGNIIITLDFDNVLNDQEHFIHFLSHLYENKRIERVYRRKSSSGKGDHYKIFFKKVPKFVFENITDDELKVIKWTIRFIFGEDFGRLKVDSYRIKAGLQEEILFYRKDGKQASNWERLL